jgi:hypothetical protein
MRFACPERIGQLSIIDRVILDPGFEPRIFPGIVHQHFCTVGFGKSCSYAA